ncbi:hypothetical protein [Candidatus Sulfurimonas baltica]|uniref:Uncharacterized protein n=1 Tax=Candidatus Sulfurimonas baltica TaxID=2740404 RepID=A0A7S7RNT5_9BACT|nr:hypothetical protein [Candidatus Sulfurimonas baltica]QOY52871.1 hypothetical protein HUE88_04070 [Candidatus Sulfurimonas baltica]
MLLSPQVLTILILNFIFAIFAIVAFALSANIFLKFDINSTSKIQYDLEKQSVLAATIIKFIFAIKIPLFLFFIFTIDKISNVLTGAMCGAGVIDATEYGAYLIALKIINLYLFAYWLKLHAEDVKYENQPYTKIKFGVFIALFFFLMVEIILDAVMFNAIDIDKMVSCCGSLYSSSSSSAIGAVFTLDTTTVLTIFYCNFLFIALFYFLKKRHLFALANILFIVVALISLISFFGTYIYALPSHHCPFCFLKHDYYYVGYIIYFLQFIGTFYGIAVGFIKESQKSYNISILFNALYVVLLSLYVAIYYIKKGVML